jgi:hypothetical protein
LKYIVVGIAAIFLAAFFLVRPIMTAQTRIAKLQTALQDKPTKDKANKALTDRLQQIESFADSRINWLDELVSISNKFPPAKQAIVDRFTATTSTSSRPTDILGQIYVDVHLLNDESLLMLETNLLTPAYKITGTGIQPDPESVDYPWTVTERIRLVTPPAETSSTESKNNSSDLSPNGDKSDETDQPSSRPLQTTNAPVQTKVEDL